MTVFNHREFNHHEQVIFANDARTGLRALIAIHDTRLGPAVGGCRMYPYAQDDDAINDVLRLSRGMTYKSALAGLPFGGGKSVIIGDPRHDKSPELMRAMGGAVERLGGNYVIAEDSGTSPRDMRYIAERTRHVSGVEDNSHGGDPSPATAYAVFLGIKAGIKHAYGSEELIGLRVAIQGLGHVGYHLARHLQQAGATVLGSDLHRPNVERAQRDFGLIPVAVDEILTASCDVFAPCAMGAILSAHTIPQLRARVVAGAANNQLAHDDDDERLLDRGIVYCPDFAINAGGIVEVYHQHKNSTDTLRKAALMHIGDTVTNILNRATASGQATQRVAIAMAEERLSQAAKPPQKVASKRIA
jgi:leucine dehydrogenase